MKKNNLNRRIDLRLSHETVAEIDAVIATHPQISTMTRTLFIRYAIAYGLLSFEKYDKEHASQETE